MTALLEVKEKLRQIYGKYEVFILPVAKFLLAFITLNALNGRMGYMTQLDDMVIVLIVALTCSFLPMGILVVFATIFSLAHMYALSMEVALVGLCVYLVMYLLYFRFSPKDALVVVLTPLLCGMRIPYVVPIAAGLLCGPSCVVSVSCGVVVYYMIEVVVGISSNIKTMGDDAILEKIRMALEGIIGNKAMIVVIAAFAVTALVVYLIRRMSVDYAWTIAILAGAVTDVAALLVGDLLYDVNFSVGGALLGNLLAVAVAMAIQFLRFCVDYKRTEKVQFEDDEYYYYVKAVPKMTVAVPARTVKRINSQQHRTGGEAERRPASGSARNAGATGRRPASAESSGGEERRRETAERTGAGRRSVTTERTNYGRKGAQRAPYGGQRGGRTASGKSVTIGSARDTGTDAGDSDTDQADEWL